MKYPSTYLVWDLETSGLAPDRDRILEIGAMLVDQGREVGSKSWLLKPEGLQLDPKITEITGITPELLNAQGVPPREALEEFLRDWWPAGETHVSHNGFRFDLPFLQAEATRNGFQLQRRPGIDTAALFKARVLGCERRWWESFDDWANRVLEIRAAGVKYNVAHCCDTLGIDRTKIVQHRALGDVELTRRIYEALAL